MAQEDANLISGKIRELTRLIRETRLSKSDQIATQNSPEFDSDHLNSSLQKVRAHVHLEALSKELEEIYKEVLQLEGAKKDNFSFSIIPGDPPRFWVDLSSFVMMVDAARTYRFLTDTPSGHKIIAESQDVHKIAQAIGEYVAEQITIDCPYDPDSNNIIQHNQKSETKIDPSRETIVKQMGYSSSKPVLIQSLPARTDWVKTILAFAFGVLCGAVGLFLVAWLQTPPAILP